MLEKGVNISLLLDCYGPLLTERQREIVDLYRNDDLSLGEISELTGITRQGVSECIRKAESILIEYEEKLGLQKLYEARKQILSDVKDKIARLSGEGKITRECADDILISLEKAEN
ncbi:MAG: YlxM family DNA-binding protein [Clostridia bacterium]|nr:YlxM family DNA-binding protein [Clostridia bacterium]